MADTIKLDGTRPLDFDRETVEQAYDRWAPVYDLVFGGVFSKGRDAAIQATNRIGGRVLEEDNERGRMMTALNERIAADERVESVLLGLNDGMTLARRRVS